MPASAADRRIGRCARVLLGTVAVALGACSPSGVEGAAEATPRPTAGGEVEGAAPGGALRGVPGLVAPIGDDGRAAVVAAADEVVDRPPRARDPLEITDTEDDFVHDAQAAWTLALAHRATGDRRYADASAAIVDDWASTTRRLEGSCPDSGGCSTSLMVSRAAPGLVHAVDLLEADGALGADAVGRFHRWLGDVVAPAASDRDNNWGDAGTYLRAVVAAELGDAAGLAEAARLWRGRIDLVTADGAIPEEVRRGDAGLMYSQEALDYKVAAADVLARHGHDVWDHRGARGGSLRAALDLVASALLDPSSWPEPAGDLRIPDPAGLWAIAAARWPDDTYRDLAGRAVQGDGDGHSAVLWTAITHPEAVR